MRSRSGSASVWLLACTGSCALAFVAWTAATLVPLEQPASAPVEIPIRLALSDSVPPLEPPRWIWGDQRGPRLVNSDEREPRWDWDHVSLAVELDGALVTRARDATALPIEDHDDASGVTRRGWFDLRTGNGVDIVVDEGSRYGGDRVEMRLVRRFDGTYSCNCLWTVSSDIGPPFIELVRGVTGHVRLSSFDWKPGTTVIVEYELTPDGGSPRTGLLSFVRY